MVSRSGRGSGPRQGDTSEIRVDSVRFRARGAAATVERLEPPRTEDWVTGQHSIYPVEEDIPSSPGQMMAPSFTREAGRPGLRPVRPRSRLEMVLRLVFAIGLFLLILVFFWDAFTQTVSRLATLGKVPWRAVTLRISSNPTGAIVYVDEKQRGVTPLQLVENCRGRFVRVRLQAPGYANWVWGGLCPRRGELRLDVQLQGRSP